MLASRLWIVTLVCGLSLLLAATSRAEAPTTVLPNGDFSKFADGAAEFWTESEGCAARYEMDGERRIVVMDKPCNGFTQLLKLEPEWKSLQVVVAMRAKDLQLGAESWNDARLAVQFEDADGKVVFAMRRGSAATPDADAGAVTMENGQVTLDIHPLELVTLRSKR